MNIGLRKRLPLMALFSGGLFIAIAGTIRAHVILNVCTPLCSDPTP